MEEEKKPEAQSEQEKIAECMKAHVLGVIDRMKKRIELLNSAYRKYKKLANSQHQLIAEQKERIAKLEACLTSGKKLIDIDEDIIRHQREQLAWNDKFFFVIVIFTPILWNLSGILNFGCRVWRHFFV